MATDASLLGLAMCHRTGWADNRPILVFSGSEGGARAATILAPPEGGGSFLLVSKGVPRILSTSFRIPTPPNPADDFRLSEDPPRAYFEWQLREEHRDELASLYYQRNAILHQAEIPWTRLSEPEQRMLNQLDAAVASGPASMAAVAAGVAAAEEGLCFAGAFLLGTLPTAQNFSLIGAALSEPVEYRLTGVAAGLVHAPDSDALKRFVTTLIESQDPAIQAMAVSVAGLRRIDIRPYLRLLVTATDARVCRAFADACRRMRIGEAVGVLRGLLSHQSPEVRRAAVLALLRIAPDQAAAYARSNINQDTEFDGALATCLGIAGQLHDEPILREHIERGQGIHRAVEALGILGAPRSVPYLVSLLGSTEEDIRVVSAVALDLMSGLHATERLVTNAPPDLPDEVSTETREVQRVNTSVDFWNAWWNTQQARLNKGARWRRGDYFSVGSCIDELADPMATYQARGRAHIELTARATVDFDFEPDWFVPRQTASIRAWRLWWEEQRDR